MAKGKAGNKESEIETDDIIKALEKQFGAGIFTTGAYVSERKRTIIPISPQLDSITGGGIREGSFIVSTGPPKIGKSSTAVDFGVSALNTPHPKYGDRNLYIFNIEGRLNPRDLRGINGMIKYLDDPTLVNRVIVVGSSAGNIKGGEEYLAIGEALINEKPGSIFLFDSFSQLCSSERRKNEIGKRFRDDMPLYLSDFCKRISNVIPINDSIVIGITHRIANQGQGHSPWVEASGQKVQYQLDVKLRAMYEQPWKVGETQIGQDVHWECDASPIGPPGRKCVSKLRYGHGLDKEAELAAMCVDLGLIKKGGAWYQILDSESKLQGMENVRDALEADPELYKTLNDQFRTMMGFQNEG